MKSVCIFSAVYRIFLNRMSSQRLTMVFVCLVDRSNSSASFSKTMPSINLRSRIFLSRSEWIYSAIKLRIWLLVYSITHLQLLLNDVLPTLFPGIVRSQEHISKREHSDHHNGNGNNQCNQHPVVCPVIMHHGIFVQKKGYTGLFFSFAVLAFVLHFSILLSCPK